MNKSDIIEIMRSYNIHPNMSLGQNFLFNQSIIDKIIQVSGIERDDNILEIGPGLGILIERLINEARSVTAVEIDSGLVRFLWQKFNDRDNLKIIHADFLKLDLDDHFTKVVSNLPYYSSSEMLFKIAMKYKIKALYVMLQKEMAERLISRPGRKSYRALTVNLGLYYEPKILFNIDKRSFYPEPDVISSFIRLIYREDIDFSEQEIDLYHRIVKSAFWGRRKTLIKSLSDSPHLKLPINLIRDIFRQTNLDEKIRGENLDIQDFKLIVKTIYQHIMK